jgi:ATP-dependent Clp protease protease subunit
MIYINFSSLITTKTAQNLMGILSELVNKGEKEICLLFSSPGGQVASGVTLYNFLKALPAKIITHNIGVVDSSGNVVFLAGAERYAVPNSSFLFHGVGFDITQPIRFEEKQLKERLLGIERDQKLIGEIIVQNTSLSLERIKEMFLEAKTLTPEEAKSAGLVNDIKPAQVPSGNKIITLVFQ